MLGITRQLPNFVRLIWPAARANLLLGCILLAGLLLRLLMVAKTSVICRDGLYYVKLCRLIDAGRWLDIGEKFLLNPYPYLMVLVARLGISYQFSGQLICAVSASLAAIPLYLWCRSAFDRRTALAATALYALHPMLILTSGEVLREGLFWLFSFTAIALLWSAAQRSSWCLFAVGCVFTTAATLTRVEGILIFLLGGMWWFAHRTVSRSNFGVRLIGPILAVLIFPAIILLTNWTFFGDSGKWHSGRLSRMTGELVAALTSGASRQATLIDNQSLHVMGKNETLKRLAERLPETAIAERRLTLLAGRHLWAVYTAHVLERILKGFEFPVAIFFLLGLKWGRQRYWKRRRDVPILVYCGIYLAVLFVYLCMSHVLSHRYVFPLLPFVFPWTAIGLLSLSGVLEKWFARVGWQRCAQPCTIALCCIFLIAVLVKIQRGGRPDKLAERYLGEMFRDEFPPDLILGGPPKLVRRVAFYGGCDYVAQPSPAQQALSEWAKAQQIHYLLHSMNLSADDRAEQPRQPDFQRVFATDPRFDGIEIYKPRGAPELQHVEPSSTLLDRWDAAATERTFHTEGSHGVSSKPVRR